MIQLLSTRYSKQIACLLGLVFYLGLVIPVYGMKRMQKDLPVNAIHFTSNKRFTPYSPELNLSSVQAGIKNYPGWQTTGMINKEAQKANAAFNDNKEDIDGPGQPEMSSFKAAGTSDMVNLFTGDFSYNIPLLDVGGYPVNIYYSGGIGMEQEASWVGLGWNINPGNVNRNMRGVPDDFNGEDTLIQRQNMKKNTTWGVSAGFDVEVVGLKNFANVSVGNSMGFSVNNYLGPAIETGWKGGASFSVGGKSASEKAPLGASIGLSANLSSRGGLTLSPNASLSASSKIHDGTISSGIGLSTSYNSRSGIKGLQLHSQSSMNYEMASDTKRDSYYNSSLGMTTLSSSISFTKPSYIPAMRSVITNSSGAGRFQLGGAMFGLYGSLEIEGYGQKSEIASADQVQKKPMVGYLYAEKANGNRNAVMDFTRFNDREVTPSTTIISVPQYAYDVFSIQGEGTGGTIRFYRNDNGYVRDNFTASKDKSWSAGVDIGIPGHIGVNFNTVKTPSTIGEWNSGNRLRNALGFTESSGDRENVYFRNPGENSVLQPNQYDSIGGTDLVRYKLGGTDFNPTIEPKLQRMTSSGAVIGEVNVQRSLGVPGRKKRTQVTSFLTAKEAGEIGLNKKIKSYDPDDFLDESNGNRLKVLEEISRDSGYRKSNHISQINVTEADGKRYIYDIPVYNLVQKDFSFTVGNDCNNCDIVPFATDEPTLASEHISGGIGSKDGYVQITETPPYAHSFLLSGLLSPDYVDVTGDGITEDDLGGAVKFNYTKMEDLHKWRTPLTSDDKQANSNPGNLSETKDDKGIVSYGERESWYLHSVESKTMIAFFTLGARSDGKGTSDLMDGGIAGSDNTVKSLQQIDLYNKADLKRNGLTDAKPVKTVHFEYDYSLCRETPDNYLEDSGKLTLKRIWFTYNGQEKSNKNQYVFSYASGQENPDYLFNASDRWGNFKPSTDNPQDMMNRDYPYSIQDKTKADQNANAWALNKILLPSGGQLEITYESDDYAFVQNKRAAIMSEIIGFGHSQSEHSNNLYTLIGPLVIENDYVFIKVPEACSSKQEVYAKYLQGVTQLAVKLTVNTPKGYEHLVSYATFGDYGVYTGAGVPAIWIRMNRVDGFSPLSRTAIEFLRQQLPGQAFPGYDVSEDSGIGQVLDMLKGWASSLKSAFSNMSQFLRQEGLMQKVQVNKSFVRLNDPDGFKYGGGQRVKKVMLKDNWKKMTNPDNTAGEGYTSVYGLEYDYTTTEVFNGQSRTISSGVASYEPSIGGEENPFQTIVQISDEVPLGPTSYGAIEMPVMDAFFPAPLVGYSKVTVTSLGKKQNPDTVNNKTRSGVGRQVTEFYTAKDFPVYYNHTPLDPASDKEKHVNPALAFFYKYAFDGRAISQGFLVATNDMHGKLKSQSSYAENDPDTRINYTQNFYRNTGVNGLNEMFDFIYDTLGGEVVQGNMGIDIELMTDTREFSVKSRSFEFQAQVDWMIPGPFPVWLPFIWPVTCESENVYRAVTTTKAISYHAVLDSVIVIDKGSAVSTKNLVYDAETGQVVVNRTNNEFDRPIYSVNYPAYWAYSGMGLAYKNIDAVYNDVDFLDGKIVDGISDEEVKRVFESGDELYIIYPGTTAGCDPVMASSADEKLIWAFNKNKNSSPLTDIDPDFIFIDTSGKPYSRTGVRFRIVRSGKRNMLGAPVAAVTLMTNPVDATTHKLTYTSGSKIINASAVEYKEKWQVDNDVIKKYQPVIDTVTCEITEVENCDGYLDKSINPYRKGLIGNFRGYRNMVFYGERKETNPISSTNLLQNGFLDGFDLYWEFNNDNHLVPEGASNSKWVWNTQATAFNSKGMELETKDALGIYTSAQYGYHKTLPVAISNNTRYNEMFAEGFEDNDYQEGINNGNSNACEKKHIDFNGVTNANIVNSDTLSFNAHTGKYMLGIKPNSTAIKQVSLISDIDSFSLVTTKDTTKSLYDLGGNVYAPTFAEPTNVLSSSTYSFSSTQTEMNIYINPVDTILPGDNRFHYYYDKRCDFYINITEAKTYNFSVSLSTTYNNYGATVYSHSNGISMFIYTLEGSLVSDYGLSQSGFSNTSGNYSVYLCPGIYKVLGVVSELYSATDVGYNYSNNHYHWECTNSSSPLYESTSVQDGCIYTKPLASTDSMLNPIFGMPLNKKMLFSAWVKQDCSSPCANKVQIRYTGNGQIDEFQPKGPIIEGWQRYEGSFIPPSNATGSALWFVNSSSDSIYFDDIRIHPFNANMQSYVYDPVNLRLTAQLDANNYASFYEYDEEGTLIRTKVETREGVKTVTETRSAKQKNIIDFQ